MSLPRTHIVIGYNNKLISESICSLIMHKPFYQVNGILPNGPELIKQLKYKTADYVLIEEDNPNFTTIEYLEKIREEYPLKKIILIANTSNNGYTSKLMSCGLSAFLLKTCCKEDFYIALSKIGEGKKFFCSTITQLLLKEYKDKEEEPPKSLTNREIQVLKCLVYGHTNKEIAYELKVSESTIKTHRKNLMEKFGAKNLIGLMRYAQHENLLDFECNEMKNCCAESN